MTSLLKRLPSLAFVLAAAIAGPVLAQAVAPRDIIIVLDNSGSMRKADPAFAMRDAVTRFASGLSADDRVALLLFDQRVRVLEGFAAAGPGAAEALSGPLEQLDYRGQLTDSPSAIERAIYELKTNARPGAERMVLFLTDGVVDTGNPALDAERAQWLREDLTQDAQASSVRIFSIAFTREADTLMVQSLAQQTGASYTRAESADELSGAFEALGASMQTVAVAEADQAAPMAGPPAPDEAPTAEPSAAEAAPTSIAESPAEEAAPTSIAEEPSPDVDSPAVVEEPPAQPAAEEAAPPPAVEEEAPVAAVQDPAAPPVVELPEAAADLPGESGVVAAEGPGADAPPPTAEPAITQLTERLGISAEEAEQLVASTELPAADVLALVDEAGLTLEELRAMGAGETVVSRPGEDAQVLATPTPPSDDLARLTERLGVSAEEAQKLVDATQLPAADLLALLDEAGLTIEELQGLAVGETVVSRPGEGTTTLRTPQVAANLDKAPTAPAGAADSAPGAATPFPAAPATEAEPAAVDAPVSVATADDAAAPTPPAPTPVATPSAPVASEPVEPAAGTPLWVILTTIGGIVALAVGALMALRPRGRQPLELTTAAASAASAPPSGPSLAEVPDAWLSDLQRHSGQERIALSAKPLAVGRVAGTDPDRLEYLVVNQPTIGRRHAIIEFREFAWFITDQGSVNGTFVNGQRIGSTGQRLRNGDRVRFHRYEFEFVQPEEMGDHEATMVAQIPGEATMVADRTLAAASTAALSSTSAAAAGLAAATSAAQPVTQPEPPAEPEAPVGALDTNSGLGSTSEPTQFNPATAPLQEEAGLDMFMASQVFGATSTPMDDEPVTEPAPSSDGSTVVLPGPVVSLDLPLDGEPGTAEAGFTATSAGVPASDEAAGTDPFSTGSPSSPETIAPAAGSLASAFDEDFFGTHEMPAMAQPEAPGDARPGRGPADVFFPEDPTSGTGDVRAAAPTSAPDHPPLDPHDDFFGEASAEAPAAGSPSPDADDGAFFATVVQAPGGGTASPAEPSPTTEPAAPPAPAPLEGDDDAAGFFATVIQPGGAAPMEPPAPAPPMSAPEPASAPVPPAAAPTESQHNETLRVRADSTVIMGGPVEEGPLLGSGPVSSAPEDDANKPRKQGGGESGNGGDFDDFFNDDGNR